jgi:hypothetical protein
MSWGGLNNALTAWRNAYTLRLPGRGTASDGARADALHGSKSQHQEDSDGTVDANDMDVNVRGSSVETGTATELRIIEAMKLDFEQDPHERGQLWIHNGEIANKDRDDWAERDYSGTTNPHRKHVHWESDQAHEDNGRTWPMPNTDRVLRELGIGNPQNDDQGETDGMQDFWKGMYEAAKAVDSGVSESNERQILARVGRYVLGPEIALALRDANAEATEQLGRIEALLERLVTAVEQGANTNAGQ